jgi:hypothetical protein
LAALALALLVPAGSLLLVVTVALLLLAALLAFAAVRREWGRQAPLIDRAVDHAWTYLAPLAHGAGFSADDSAFLAGLALTSVGHGQARRRERLLAHLVGVTEKAVTSGARAARDLAALWRLALADQAAAGADLVPLVARQAGRSFEGRLPLAFAEGLLEGWRSEVWAAGNLARLRVLLCDRAFEAGLELRDLVEVGRHAPSLGSVLGVEDTTGLARLRLLWSLRPRRPWDRCGEAKTVFEIAAASEGAALLEKYPDLLLHQAVPAPLEESAVGKPVWAEILLCGRGLVFEDTLFREPPREAAVELSRGFLARGGFDLVLGDFRFRFASDPQPLAGRLERWFDFAFAEFLPEAGSAVNWQSPGVAASLRAEEAMPCPECGTVFLPCVGDVGVLVGALPPH